MDREAYHAAVHGIAKSQIGLSHWAELNMELNPTCLVAKTQDTKGKQYFNKFSKTFKMVHIKKKKILLPFTPQGSVTLSPTPSSLTPSHPKASELRVPVILLSLLEPRLCHSSSLLFMLFFPRTLFPTPCSPYSEYDPQEVSTTPWLPFHSHLCPQPSPLSRVWTFTGRCLLDPLLGFSANTSSPPGPKPNSTFLSFLQISFPTSNVPHFTHNLCYLGKVPEVHLICQGYG